MPRSPGFPAWAPLGFVLSSVSGSGRVQKNIPPPLEPVPQDKIVHVQLGMVARIVMAGADEQEAQRVIEGQRFAHERGVMLSSNEDIFTIEMDPADPAVALIHAVGVGVAGLALKADAAVEDFPDDKDIIVPLEDLLTIDVYSIATRIVVFYTVSGIATDYVYVEGDRIHVPLNKTVTVRMEGWDDAGRVISVQSQVFTDFGAPFSHLTEADPPVAGTAVIVPDQEGAGYFVCDLDGDPSSGVAPLQTSVLVSVVTPYATHLIEQYGIEAPA